MIITNLKYQINQKRPKYLILHLTGKGKSISAITFYFLLCFISEVINSQDAAPGQTGRVLLSRLMYDYGSDPHFSKRNLKFKISVRFLYEKGDLLTHRRSEGTGELQKS